MIELIVVALLSFAGGAYSGIQHERANSVELELVAERAADKVSERSAHAIAAIEIKNTTINNEVREIITLEKVYSDCKHTPEAYEKIRKTLTNE